MKINTTNKENIVLLIGITIFMLFYYFIKKQIDSSFVFVFVSFFYLILLKICSKYLSKKKWPF